jgi:hypothetical protein
MRTKHAVVVAGVCLLLTAGPAWAHHAFSSEFDVTKPLTLKGTVVKWEMINPHSWFHIEVKDPDGNVVEWMIEGGSPNSLIRQGVTKNSIQIGMLLTIEGYQAKDATNKAVGRNFVLPDGKRLFVGSQSGPDSKAAPGDQER